ncbi:hypothetical protein P3W45_000555 [Vairimorpha bombi]|jgi:hypothetical protein
MTKSTSSADTRILFKEDHKQDELNNIKQENIKLKGEVSLLRQNMLTLEKSNYALRLEKSEIHKSNLKSSRKQEIELLKIQYKINENKPSPFKRFSSTNSIDIRWALEHSHSDINFKLEPFEYKRLKFFKDYFYNEFYQFDTKIIIKYLDEFSRCKYKKFLDYFVLFSCKIDVFNSFFHLVFINNHFIDQKIGLLEDIPLDWIINYRNGEALPLIKEFIDKFSEKMVVFMHKVVSERPFVTNLLLDSRVFSEMILVDNYMVRFLIDKVCLNGGLNLINKYNLHYLNKDQLKMIYKDEYMDIL